MQTERTVQGRPGETSTCVGCGAGVDGDRCQTCGVAVAPNGWRVVRQLAQGPYSRVFLAEKGGVRVALKELLFALVPEAAQLEGFEREARLLAQLKHPAIPRLVESFQVGQGVNTRLYLAQEFVSGRSLLQELEQHRFDEKEIRALAREVLGILEYLHGLSPRVIHRDLKPANLMRRDDGSLALVDFGAARDLVRGVTHGATLVGTFGYMPPEQLGGTVDLTADLYALGATLLHLLSRQPPEALLREGLDFSFDGAVNVSPAFLGWLQTMVARDRGERFQSAAKAKEALEALERPAPPRPAAAENSGKSAASVLATFALVPAVAAVFLGSIWFLGRTRVESRPTPPVTTLPRPLPPAPPPVVVPVPPTPAPPPPVEPPRPPSSRPVEPRPPAVHSAPVEVQAVPKVKPLPSFVLESPFKETLTTVLPLGGAACPAGGATLTLDQVRVEAGTPAAVVLVSRLHNESASAACANVYLELRDQLGGRDPSRATLLSNPTPGSTRSLTTRFTVPENHKSVQLRLGPQAKPLAVVDVDLAGAKVSVAPN
ncbi:MAG: serine/threonine protein kinase [Myxococcaceae bacterium]|nr:serine/threonine protein kinase [Myxococcaceae bacterium]